MNKQEASVYLRKRVDRLRANFHNAQPKWTAMDIIAADILLDVVKDHPETLVEPPLIDNPAI